MTTAMWMGCDIYVMVWVVLDWYVFYLNGMRSTILFQPEAIDGYCRSLRIWSKVTILKWWNWTSLIHTWETITYYSNQFTTIPVETLTCMYELVLLLFKLTSVRHPSSYYQSIPKLLLFHFNTAVIMYLILSSGVKYSFVGWFLIINIMFLPSKVKGLSSCSEAE